MLLGEWALETLENSSSGAGAHDQGTRAASLLRFLVFSSRFSIWKLLWTWNEFSLLCIVFKYLLGTIGLQFHILDPSSDGLICRFIWFLTTKRSKHLWSCMI